MSKPVTVRLLSVGLLGPGLDGWPTAMAILQGKVLRSDQPTNLNAPARLPATERRRAGAIIKISVAVADEALAAVQQNPQLPTVFSASSGDGVNCHQLCEALAGADRALSPTRFTNSVHNAAAGYWHIATHSTASSTSLCAFDASFGMGLLEAALQAHGAKGPVLYVAADTPYPEPLQGARPMPDAFAVAMLLAPDQASDVPCMARLHIAPTSQGSPSTCQDHGLETLRQHIPAARCLPLLERLASLVDGSSGDAPIIVDGLPDFQVQLGVTSCLGAGKA